jgi:hypothetical protein
LTGCGGTTGDIDGVHADGVFDPFGTGGIGCCGSQPAVGGAGPEGNGVLGVRDHGLGDIQHGPPADHAVHAIVCRGNGSLNDADKLTGMVEHGLIAVVFGFFATGHLDGFMVGDV